MLLSEVEQELCANPNNKFVWIAVDACGAIYAYQDKPYRNSTTWFGEEREKYQGVYTGGLHWHETLRRI